MSDETTLEQAKNDLTTILAKLKTANKNALKNVIDSELPETTPERNESNPESYVFRLLILIAIIFVIGVFASKLVIIDASNPFERKDFYFLLAFSVALASYLATTVRELVKSIKTTANYDKKRKLKWNIFFITAAEASLLYLGVMVIYRIGIGSFTLRIFGTPSDKLIVSYLAVILVYLVVLHIRAWFSYPSPPWKIYPKKN